MYIDAHQHFWRLERGDYSWLKPELGALYGDFMPEDLLGQLRSGGVGRTILVQAAPSEAETRFLYELSRQDARFAGVVGWVDFEAENVVERMRALARDGAGILKGLRPMVQDIADPHWLARGSLDVAFDAMITNDMAFDALVNRNQIRVLTDRLQRHPALRAVLDHAGKPDIAHGDFQQWGEDLARLAATTSVHCKLSGLLTQAPPGVSPEQLDPYVAHVFGCFGADRVMWGSDWPVLTTRGSYQQWLSIALELVRRHAPGCDEAVFGANAKRFYKLGEGSRLE